MISNRKTRDKKDTYVRARVTKKEKELIETYAKFNGMSVSDYIMNLIWKDMERE